MTNVERCCSLGFPGTHIVCAMVLEDPWIDYSGEYAFDGTLLRDKLKWARKCALQEKRRSPRPRKGPPKIPSRRLFLPRARTK